jgi:sec-independent protein translocase protein TatC
MNFGSSQQPDPDDYFADTRMSFGDHIEELRTHLWKAIAGFLIALVFSFFIGKPVLGFIAAPVERELQRFWDKDYGKRRKEYKEGLRQGTIDPGRPVEMELRLSKSDLKKAGFIEAKADGPKPLPLDVMPFIQPILDDLELGDWMDAKQAKGGQYVEVRAKLVNPAVLVEETQKFHKLLNRRPALATLNVQEAFLVYFQVCLVTGFVLASPWVFYQIWSFIAAGLYPQEKRLVNVFLPVSIGLFLIGVLVCEFLVIPKAVEALLWFNEWLNLQPELRLNEWLSFAILMPLIFGLAFQTPLVMLFLERIGVVDVPKFRSMRRIAWFVLALLSAIVVPSTDAYSMLLLWLPMCLLYELGIWMCLLAPKRPSFDDDDVPKSDELIEV